MYIAVVMTGTYKVVQRGESYEEREEAKEAAKQMPLHVGQMHAVIDNKNVVQWKGGVKAAAKPASKHLESGLAPSSL